MSLTPCDFELKLYGSTSLNYCTWFFLIQIGEREHAEIEQGLKESLHSVQVNTIEIFGVTMVFTDFCTPFIQDQYDKLLKNYEAMGVDRGFMVESMTALKKRNEELVSELQQCKVCINIPADLWL